MQDSMTQNYMTNRSDTISQAHQLIVREAERLYAIYGENKTTTDGFYRELYLLLKPLLEIMGVMIADTNTPHNGYIIYAYYKNETIGIIRYNQDHRKTVWWHKRDSIFIERQENILVKAGRIRGQILIGLKDLMLQLGPDYKDVEQIRDEKIHQELTEIQKYILSVI